MAYTPIETAIRLIPMFVAGIICNLIVGFMAAHIPLVWILGALFLNFLYSKKYLPFHVQLSVLSGQQLPAFFLP